MKIVVRRRPTLFARFNKNEPGLDRTARKMKSKMKMQMKRSKHRHMQMNMSMQLTRNMNMKREREMQRHTKKSTRSKMERTHTMSRIWHRRTHNNMKRIWCGI